MLFTCEIDELFNLYLNRQILILRLAGVWAHDITSVIPPLCAVQFVLLYLHFCYIYIYIWVLGLTSYSDIHSVVWEINMAHWHPTVALLGTVVQSTIQPIFRKVDKAIAVCNSWLADGLHPETATSRTSELWTSLNYMTCVTMEIKDPSSPSSRISLQCVHT